MNVFAALAIALVMQLSDFVAMDAQEKLHSFGALLGTERMVRLSSHTPYGAEHFVASFPQDL